MMRVSSFRRGASAEGDAFEPALTLEGISMTFGRRSALQDVSIRLGAGELVVLLGPNGAGKTTLSLIVAGLVRPDAGSVRVAGIGLRDRPSAALASIGLVFQQPTLDLERSVGRNLLFHADLQGLPRASARRRIEEELGRFGLSDAAHRATRELSGGNRRRVELARALLHSPAVLFLDEPTSGLDPASRRDLLRHVRMLCSDREVAALWATNLVEEAEPADRIVVLQHGRVLTEAHPRDLRLRGGATTLNEAFLALTGVEPTLRAAE